MSSQAIRNQRLMSKAQANFDARQHPDYYKKGPTDEEEVIKEEQEE
jgi:hypothetical protein